MAVRDKEQVEAGQVHHIKDGVLHATVIPPSLDTLTLVLDSPNLGYNTTTVLDCDQSFPTQGRALVADQEVAHVQAVLRQLAR